MPKTAARRRRSVVVSTGLVAASVAVLLVNPVSTPLAGAAVAPGSTLRASVNNDGTESSAGGFSNAISADGSAVAFSSSGRLDPSLSNAENQAVYVRDIARNKTVMISRGRYIPPVVELRQRPLLELNGSVATRDAQPAPGEEIPPNGFSHEPSISADGRFVAFITSATNIVYGTSGNTYVVVCDRNPDGDTDFDELVDVPGGRPRLDHRCISVNRQYQGASFSQPRIAANASRIVWHEWRFSEGDFDSWVMTATLTVGATGLAAGPPERVPASLGLIGLVDELDAPAVSGNGRFVVVAAEVRIPCDCDDNSFDAILSVDMDTDATARVDFDGAEPIGTTGSGIFLDRPAVSFDGTVIAFEAGDFDRFGQPNVYVVTVDYARPFLDQVTGTLLASRNNAGEFVNGAEPALSGDGRYLAFVTDALDAHDGEDRATGEQSCLTPSDVGFAGRRPLSFAADLPPERPDVRTVCQIVVRDLAVDRALPAEQRVPGVLASPGGRRDCVLQLPLDASCAGFSNSFSPSLSADGSRVAFDSFADDLVPGDNGIDGDVFVRTFEPSLSADPIDFGQVQIGQTLVRTVTVEEVGAGPLSIEEVALAGPDADDFQIIGQTCQGVTLHRTLTCLVTVEFGPDATGIRNGDLLVGIRGGRTLNVDLLGSGTPVPVPRAAEFSAEPSPLAFGERLLLSDGPELTVTVSNGGEQPLVINSVSPVGPGTPGDFTITANTCVTAIPANGTCRVSVAFSPAEPGVRTAALRFDDNAPGGPHLVGLSGSAGPMSILANPGVSPPGRVTTVTGVGFPPGRDVTVTFEERPGTATGTVAADGTFRVPLLIFPKAAPETRSLVATVDGALALTARTTLLIVFPSVNPADFVVRG